MKKIPNKEKQILFTIAYYNALDYYPTSFFIWKNLINIQGKRNKFSLEKILTVIKKLQNENKIENINGMYKIAKHQERCSQKSANNKDRQDKKKDDQWYKKQIQKNKISVDKIKRAKRWASISRWLPYLRGLFLTGTLAMKRGGNDGDWDVLVILKKDRIWLGRLIITTWFQLIGKRRYGKKIKNRFCLNQFVVEDKIKFEEKNIFFGNELVMAEELLDNTELKNLLIEKNKKWIRKFKPNMTFRGSINSQKNQSKKILKKSSLFWQRCLEKGLEILGVGRVLNLISKKIMIKKIIDNPKTYSPGADIRYGDFFLVFLPQPQRTKIETKALKLLTKMSS